MQPDNKSLQTIDKVILFYKASHVMIGIDSISGSEILPAHLMPPVNDTSLQIPQMTLDFFRQIR